MKSSDELFEQYKNTNIFTGDILHREMFNAVMSEHDNEIRSIIIKLRSDATMPGKINPKYISGYIAALNDFTTEMEKK